MMGGFSFGGGATSASWSTGGDGLFVGNVYTPGTNDKSNGFVVLTYTTNDPAGPCGVVSDFMTLTINTCNITGTLKYFNNAQTSLTGRTLTLNCVPPITATWSGSAYTLANVPSGTFTVGVVTPVTANVGGINSTDAAAANTWNPSNTSIQYVKFLAGDVNLSNSVTATDALRIQNYFVYGDAFNGSPWVYYKKNTFITNNPLSGVYNSAFDVTIVTSSVAYDVYGMCKGDFNGSFSTPLKAASSTLTLNHNDTKLAGAGKDIELPVRMMHASTVGAVSLILNFPNDLMEVTGITMKDNGGTLAWVVKGNELRIGWNSAEPLNFNANEDLLVISLKTSSTFSQGDAIRIELAADQLNELADGNISVIPDVVLGVDVLEFSTNGIGVTTIGSSITLDTRPNPFAVSTILTYNLPAAGLVTLVVKDMLGRVVTTLVNETQSNGKHSVTLDAMPLQPGVYFATVTLRNSSGEMVRTIKLVRNH